MTPTIYIVGADKGGTGKTTVTRLLLDYFRQNAIDFKAYDTEFPGGALQRFFPDRAEIVDMNATLDMARVFDNLSPTAVTVLDVRAGLLSPMLTKLGNIGLFRLADAGKLRVVALHVVGPATQSLEEIAPIMSALKGSRHIVVANHVNDTAYAVPDGAITIPKLDENASKAVDAAAKPFKDYVESNVSFTLCGTVGYWMGEVFAQFDEQKLNVLK